MMKLRNCLEQFISRLTDTLLGPAHLRDIISRKEESILFWKESSEFWRHYANQEEQACRNLREHCAELEATLDRQRLLTKDLKTLLKLCPASNDEVKHEAK